MASTEPPRTPTRSSAVRQQHVSPITPEQVRRMEENRLRAKALQAQRTAATLTRENSTGRSQQASSYLTAGQKRPHNAISRDSVPATSRDARNPAATPGLAPPSKDHGIRAAKKFQKYVEYDFSKMTDTKGGFMTQEDDPTNKKLHAPETADGKPAHMTLREWEQVQLRRKLRDQRSGPYEPGLSVLDKANKKCRECGSLEIDWLWDETFHCQVCNGCKEKLPEKYSLLTKTEAREDYLFTDPELKDETILPHLEKPNPRKATFHNMMLYLRYQVEEFAFSEQKWGSPEALDEEFEKRTKETKERKEKKFRNKLNELKKRTRVEAYKKARGGGGGEFGDVIGNGRHEHEWGRAVEDPETGMTKKACLDCGMEVEELVF